MAKQSYQTILIGAGQAGLAAAYHLRKQGVSFIGLDGAGQAGDSWRSRYDSLTLFTPRRCDGLPGFPMSGDPHGFPTKDEVADYLQAYRERFELPIRYGARVVKAERHEGRFRLKLADGETLYAEQLLAATGPFQKPAVPQAAASLDEGVLQLHSSEYRHPAQLQAGPVLVVGAGNSGAQIAVELSGQGREVLLSASGPIRVLPLRFLGRSIFHWMDRLGLLRASGQSLMGRWLRKQRDPVFGRELTESLRRGAIRLMPRVSGAEGRDIRFADGSLLKVANVIWATGFRPDYSWLRVDGALDGDGRPLHTEGVSPVPGLYYLGLPWQRSRSSALIAGAAGDAAYVTARMQEDRLLGSRLD
ncbi:putative flavoprotein involved in K+ transport [Paenibacillus sp. UNCCL117]|uniref:flavin-containing monooxygenase n=1 Tax=unclassified Paenibacillus TaxID=185978 RepID=UPI00088D7F0B|nr:MULTISPECIES: NAD(P)-binding domain-containing protein [unclassified Paenibacillus]SDD15267.1 putative flavoprotein involved in K+ transport [Paenibacillus sp. cl123]SFW34405.1 putative flavoprotein involved in K+ transport [Paenibacillus sp. UNCCL117]